MVHGKVRDSYARDNNVYIACGRNQYAGVTHLEDQRPKDIAIGCSDRHDEKYQCPAVFTIDTSDQAPNRRLHCLTGVTF